MKRAALKGVRFVVTVNLEKEKNKAYRRGIRDAERNCAVLFLYALRNEFQFGPTRMRKMADMIIASADALFSKYCSIKDMAEVLKDECNMELVQGIGMDYRFTDIINGKCEKCGSEYHEGKYCAWCGCEILEVR